MLSATGHHWDAENLAQETLLRAQDRIGGYRSREGTPFRAWLFRIAHRVLCDHLRRMHLIEFRSLDDGIEDEPGGRGVSDFWGSWFAGRELEDALGKLDLFKRQALILHHHIGLNFNETAELLGRTPAAVRQASRRGVVELGREMDRTRPLTLTPAHGRGSGRREWCRTRLKRLPVLRARRWAL